MYMYGKLSVKIFLDVFFKIIIKKGGVEDGQGSEIYSYLLGWCIRFLLVVIYFVFLWYF